MTLVSRNTMQNDDGTNIFGTVVTKAFIDQMYDQIDDQCHSLTNPDQTPAETTDEVVEARDTFDTLAERLDSIAGSEMVTDADLSDQILSINLIPNSDLDFWSLGGAAVPDGYSIAGTGAAVARTGAAQSDTTHLGAGTSYSAKLTFGSAAVKFGRMVIPTITATSLQRVRGRTISASIVAQTSVINQARLVIDDGIGTTASDYHSGGGMVEVLTVSRVLSDTATKINIYLQMDVAGVCYVGGLSAVWGASAPSDWSFQSWPVAANAGVPGIVTPDAQVFNGIKTLAKGHPRLEPGASTVDAYANIVGTTFTDVSNAANTGAIEKLMTSHTIPANVFDVVGRVMRIRCTLLIANTAASKKIRFFWNNVQIGTDHDANTGTAGAVIVNVDIVKSSADAQRITLQVQNQLGGDNADNNIFTATKTEDDGATITWEIRAQSGLNDGDITHHTTYEWVG